MRETFDFIILGAGMAGASVAAELAQRSKGSRVLLLETEDQPGRHATGRSAAMFFESYGNATVRALTRASRSFLQAPPADFADAPLLTPRAAMIVADAHALERLKDTLRDNQETQGPQPAPAARLITSAEALQRVPILRADRVAAAVLDGSGSDIDVAALHQGFLRAAKRCGVNLVLDASETRLSRTAGAWEVSCRAGVFHAPVIVNATGAWADHVALRAGVPPVGLQPMRRTAVLIAAPDGQDCRNWPMVIDTDETVYFKPDAGQLLLSPANEDPIPPCDVVPEELDIAIAVDRFEALTNHRVTRINHRWAGLRSFVADRAPVAGFDPNAEGFFWLAGQGGYGIQMAPALARCAAALLVAQPLPDDVVRQGITEEELSPARLRCLQTEPGQKGS